MMANIPRTSINEANLHLHALQQRVWELENTAKDQRTRLLSHDSALKQLTTEITVRKDAEIKALQDCLQASEQKNIMLEELLKEREAYTGQLQDQCRVLDRIMSYRPALEGIIETMSTAAVRSGSATDSGFCASDGYENLFCTDTEKSPEQIYIGSSNNAAAVRRIAKIAQKQVGRQKQFSISEDEDEVAENLRAERRRNSLRESLKDKEVYL